MAEVLRQNGFKVKIWSNDHLPHHVHVYKGGEEIVINLGEDKDALPEIREIYMNAKDAAIALELVYEHQEELIKKWNQIWEEGHDKAKADSGSDRSADRKRKKKN